MKPRRWAKSATYGGVFIIGIACLLFAYHQHCYVRLIRSGNQALSEKRLDTQEYDQAGHYWLARRDILSANQGMLAYTGHFSLAIPKTKSIFSVVRVDDSAFAHHAPSYDGKDELN